jgi:hydroxymethylpyrimidine pyrophosphatase-like HAD family hydrolase
MINFSKKYYLTKKETKWVLVDFDGTIHPYDKKDKKYSIKNPPMKGAKETLEKIEKLGYKICIYTARPWSDYKPIEGYLLHYQIPFSRIFCGKVFGVLLIDDKAFRLTDWTKDKKKILKFLTERKKSL